MNSDLTGHICLISGASRGIGKVIAVAMGKCGATVVGTSTNANGAHLITEMLKSHDITGTGMPLDVCQSQSVATVIDDIVQKYGPISILVNNAGITNDNLLLRMDEKDWDNVINTNLTSIYRLSKAVLRNMTKRRYGRIINITSVVACSGNAGQTNYCAAKAGIIGFSKSLAREVAVRGITVNTVAPGFIETDMTARLTKQQIDRMVVNIPVSRLGTPQDVANAVLFLASPGSSYITGSTIHVNGGLYMT